MSDENDPQVEAIAEAMRAFNNGELRFRCSDLPDRFWTGLVNAALAAADAELSVVPIEKLQPFGWYVGGYWRHFQEWRSEDGGPVPPRPDARLAFYIGDDHPMPSWLPGRLAGEA